jgi:hypothetical protein
MIMTIAFGEAYECCRFDRPLICHMIISFPLNFAMSHLSIAPFLQKSFRHDTMHLYYFWPENTH